MPMSVEAVQKQVSLFLSEIEEAIADDLADVEFIVCASREAAVERLNALLDPTETDKVVLDEIPVDAKGIFFGDPAETVEAQDNDGETDVTIDCANGAIVLLCPNLDDENEVDFILLHEIGHALGLDEDEVEALGLGVDVASEGEVPAETASESTPADVATTTPNTDSTVQPGPNPEPGV